MSDFSAIRDAIQTSLDMARDLREKCGIVGYGIVELRHEDGSLGLVRPFANLVTDVGDLYYATQAIAGVPPANGTGSSPKITGMQLGTSTNAVAKNGANSGMVAFISGAGVAFDSTWPKTVNLGANNGVEAEYKTTFVAGVGTSTTVNEAVITTGTITTTSAAASTISRILTGTINKGSSDSLAITWKHKFLGA